MMDYSTKIQLIDTIIEPFNAIDGSVYFSKMGRQIKCKSVNVAVRPECVHISDDYNYFEVSYEVKFSTLGYKPLPEYRVASFCNDIRWRMRDKLGYLFDYSDAELTDTSFNIYQFWVTPRQVEQKLKSW